MSANIGGGGNTDGFSMYISGNRVHHNTNIIIKIQMLRKTSER